MKSPYRNLWRLDPGVHFLNHGSFGATPIEIQELQRKYRDQMEAEPVRFLIWELPELMNESREELARFVGAKSENIVFVRNATYAVNSVLRSYPFREGDELLITNLEYNACTNIAKYVCEREKLSLKIAEVPFPFENETQLIDSVLAGIGPKTRLVMLDHVTSTTGFVMPIKPIIDELNRRGIDSLIDGSHSVGMLPLALEELGATFFTSNCHKWLCSPKGSAFLYAREDRKDDIVPAAISHGWNMAQPGTPRFHDLFDWTGTDDPSPWLCVGPSIRFFERILKGGFDTYRSYNHELMLKGRQIICDKLNLTPPCPEEFLGSLSSLFLPDEKEFRPSISRFAFAQRHPVQVELLERFNIEVPVYAYPGFPKLIIRIAACLYNDPSEYEALAQALTELI